MSPATFEIILRNKKVDEICKCYLEM